MLEVSVKEMRNQQVGGQLRDKTAGAGEFKASFQDFFKCIFYFSIIFNIQCFILVSDVQCNGWTFI